MAFVALLIEAHLCTVMGGADALNQLQLNWRNTVNKEHVTRMLNIFSAAVDWRHRFGWKQADQALHHRGNASETVTDAEVMQTRHYSAVNVNVGLHCFDLFWTFLKILICWSYWWNLQLKFYVLWIWCPNLFDDGKRIHKKCISGLWWEPGRLGIVTLAIY